MEDSLKERKGFGMRGLSLFSGAGGMDVGFEAAGFRTALACEIDRSAAATFRSNFGCGMHEGDVRELLPSLEPGMADVVFGGPPCQGFSVAGKMDPSDPRSGLVMAFMEAVARVRPKAFVMENVDALAKLAKWAGTLGAIREAAARAGYGVHVEVLDASRFGVPQKRHRMFMWGAAGRTDHEVEAAVLGSLAESMTAQTPSFSVFSTLGPAGTERNPATATAAITFARNPILRRSAYAGMLFNGAGRPVDPAEPAPTMAASAGGNRTHIVDEGHVFGGNEPFVEAYLADLQAGAEPRSGKAPSRLRRLTLAESMAFQTFPEGFRFEGSRSSIYRQVGNAVPCRLAKAAARAARALITSI